MTSDTGASPDFLVPVTLHLTDVAVTMAELAGLTPGGALSLGPAVSGLDVDLRVAGRLVARAELVRIGDRFAAMIVDVPGSQAPTDDASPDLLETSA